MSTVRVWLLSLALGLVIPAAWGQEAAENPVRDPVIQEHFAAAQQAQRDNDYATAEREYQRVIALSPNFAEVRMNLGLVYQQQNRYPEAMNEFRRALKIKPTLAGANFFLGVDYCKAGDGARAIPFLKAALKASPGQPEIRLWLATAQEITGDIAAQVATLRQALESHPHDVDILYLLGHAYERLGKQEAARLESGAADASRKEQFLAESYAVSNEWPSAVIHFQNALAATPQRPGLHVALGEVLLGAGKINQAAKEFEQELALDPNNLRALVRRGEVRLVEGDVDSALDDWTRATAVDQTQVEKILGLRHTAFGNSGSEQLHEAVREKLSRLNGEHLTHNSTAARLATQFIATQTGNLSPAATENSAASVSHREFTETPNCSESDLKRVLQQWRYSDLAACAKSALTPRAPVELRLQVVAGLLETGEYEESLRILEELPHAEKSSPEASYWRARCFEKLATAVYLRLYQADPNSHRLHQLMGDIEAARGDDGKAIEEYRAAIALKPSLPNMHYSLGHLLWKDLKVPEARVELEAEIALNPRHAGALNDLGDTYLLEHQPEKALPLLERALAADAGNSDIHRDLGTAYSELKDYRKAEEQFKIAIADDHDGSVHYKLARVYQALGEKENAAREFALSTSLNRESHSKLEKQTERLAEITKATQEP
ncbi:MAG: tetratricopeptide repeat protein [Candidatus Acidiferrum sp.]